MINDSYHAVVYGPLRTKQFGKQLGINVMPSTKEACDSDCIFCQAGVPDALPVVSRTLGAPSSGVVVTSAARKIIELSKAGDKIQTLLVTGNSEPTLHPGLLEITENLRTLRDKWFPKAKLVLSTETTDLTDDSRRHALTIYDRVLVRFEWGTAKLFGAMTGEPTTHLRQLQDHLRPIDRLTVLATFMKGGPIDNSTESEVRNWLKRLEELRPKEVLIQTLEKPATYRDKKFRPVSISRLEKIAAQLEERLEVQVSVLAAETRAA